MGAWLHGIAHVPATVILGRRRPEVITKLLLANLVPYLAILYIATLHYGIVGAAAAWAIRAAFDPILFVFTRPRRADMGGLLVSAALVLAAMIAALTMAWTSTFYWLAIGLLMAAACYQHRVQLIGFAKQALRFRTNYAA
jgi:O-antigen/teichoic acid export membrane protein